MIKDLDCMGNLFIFNDLKFIQFEVEKFLKFDNKFF